MENALTIIKFAVAALILVVFISIGFNYMNKGRAINNQASDSIDRMVDSLSDAEYKTYDGLVIDGSTVQDVIRYSFGDSDVEILVSTKDGKDLVYNGGGSTAPYSGTLTGIPNKNAAGNPFGTVAMATTTMGSGGYETSAASDTPGYIYNNSNFRGSLQYDANGQIRRVTFVQE